MKTIRVVNDAGVPFNVKLVRQGDNYGLRNCLTHELSDPIVEFFDARYNHTEHGQFVSSYFLSTLNERGTDFEGQSFGINLDGGSQDWYVTGENVDDVLGWANYQMDRG